MKDITSKHYSVYQLRKEFDERKFAIPELQREFVWTHQKVCALTDSIFKNYPIGTVMIWKTQRRNQNLLRKRLHILPPFNDKNKNIHFILDGQQRLSVLYHLFKGDQIVNANGNDIDFGRIYFSLYKENGEIRFKYAKRPDPEWQVKLSDILDPYWRGKFNHYPQYKINEIQQCRDNILNYKFYMLVVKTNNLDEIRETFIRINSLGTPLRAADSAFARASKVKLRHLIHELRSSLEHGFDAIPYENILMIIALFNGSLDVGKRAISAIVDKIENDLNTRKKFERSWKRLKEAIGKAIDYIVPNYGVINYDFLPSTNMVTTLSLFFYYNNNAQPNIKQKKELKKWFWSTALGQRYAGVGFRKNILNDASFFKRLGKNRTGRFVIEEKIPLYTIKHADYSGRSGITDAYFCLLILQKPRYLSEGDYIPLNRYSTRANRKDKHHIFPRDLLRRNGFSKGQYNSICNICFIVAKENQTIGSNSPAKYLDELSTKRHFARVMKSHLIPYKQASGLWEKNVKKGYKIFLSERIKLIIKAFEERADTKLFRRD